MDGQQAAFEKQAMVHMNALYRVALKYTHNDAEAEDLVQDTLFKAYNNFNTYESGTNCRAWLLRILTNTFINRYRRGKRERAYVESVINRDAGVSLVAEPADAPLECAKIDVQEVEPFAFSDEIVRAMNAISGEFKSIIVLADLQDFSYKEIAEKLHIPIGTVMSRLFRGRQMLKKSLKGYASSFGYSS